MENKINQILNEYDFTDSIIYQIEVSDLLTKVVLKIDYYWDYHEGKENTRKFIFEFEDCSKIESNLSENALISMKKGDRYSHFTTIDIRCIGENLVEFFNDYRAKPFLRIAAKKINIYIEKD